MTGDLLRFGIVGAGAIAPSYAQALEGSPLARLTAVADIRAAAARALAQKASCQAFSAYQVMAEKAGLDAVIICTPPATHPEITAYFLDRKIHVLCEKPLCIDSDSARRMVDHARKMGVKLTMGSKFRYVDDLIRAKSIVSSGILGQIILFENAFTSRVDMSKRWNSDPGISGGGVLIDNGSHSVDIMRYFLGPLAEVHVVEGNRVQGLPVEDTVRIFVRSTRGVMGSIDLSWSINKELDSYVNIYGSRGTISVGWKESKFRQSSSPDWVVFGKGYNKLQAFRSQIQNFCRAIHGQEALLITADDALASVEVIEAAYAALRQHPWIPVGADNGDRERSTKEVLAVGRS
jgi:predicted dehydrogenase